MKLQFLGTGAADWPDKPVNKAGMFRHHASLLVNERILIDPGPEVCNYARTLPEVDLEQVEAIFVTHTHEDHWNTDTVNQLLQITKQKVHVYFYAKAGGNLHLDEKSTHGNGLSQDVRDKLVLCPVRRGQKVCIENTVWQNLEANHYIGGGETGSHYLITDGEETWFYGCDGGWFTTRTWDVLRKHRFDGIILDGTVGENSSDFRLAGHNTLEMNRILAKAMKQQGMLKPEAKLYLSHFGMTTYENGPEDIRERVESVGFRMAVDGMTAERILPKQNSPFDGGKTDGSQICRFKTVGGIGDSLASGGIVSLNPDGSRRYTDYYEHSWGQYMARDTGITFTNYSVGGLTTKTWYEAYGKSDVFLKCPQDLYLIGLGCNDANAIESGTMHVGTMDDLQKDADSFVGWYGRIIRLIRQIQPDAPIIVITDPMPTPLGMILNDYIRKMSEVFSGVLVMDLERYASDLYDEEKLTREGLWHLGHMTAGGYQYAAGIMMTYMDVLLEEKR